MTSAFIACGVVIAWLVVVSLTVWGDTRVFRTRWGALVAAFNATTRALVAALSALEVAAKKAAVEMRKLVEVLR